jgi:hypothetical protein
MPKRSRWWFLQGMTPEQFAELTNILAKLQVRAEEVKAQRAKGMCVQPLRRTK